MPPLRIIFCHIIVMFWHKLQYFRETNSAFSKRSEILLIFLRCFGFLYCYKEVNFISKSLSQPGLLKDNYTVPWTCFSLKRVVVPWTWFLPLSCLDVGSLGCIYQFITFWCQENDENPVASSKMVWLLYVQYLRFWVSPGHAWFLINISTTIFPLFEIETYL